MEIGLIGAGLALLGAAAFLIQQEFKRIKADHAKKGSIVFLGLILELLSLSPFYLAFALLILGSASLLKALAFFESKH